MIGPTTQRPRLTPLPGDAHRAPEPIGSEHENGFTASLRQTRRRVNFQAMWGIGCSTKYVDCPVTRWKLESRDADLSPCYVTISSSIPGPWGRLAMARSLHPAGRPTGAATAASQRIFG